MFFSLMSVTLNDSSEAFFFKKKKEQAKTQPAQVSEKAEKKIIVAEIFASWCPACKNIQPTLDQLAKEGPNIDLVQLDVSTPSKAKEAAKKAKELKIDKFYDANKSKTSTVGIIVPTSSEIVSIFQNNTELEEYKAAIQDAKTKEKALYN